ncbi:MAG: antibiotic biosynthesis monooxygenase [Bryobacterales bacterium]|nr:antibiotic biosynthesis monooxygenase [Bryobacterales bacterium]
MKTVLVHVHVKPEQIEAFREATLDNARHSALEPGNVRFEVYQQADDPARFVLMEIFRDAEAQAAHRETAHYLRWRELVADMMAEPRRGVPYVAAV